MEFKGTKGKWYLQEYTDAYTNIIRCYNGIHNTLYLASTSQCTNSEERYNAQIMAHAPELLDMLRYIYEETNFQSHFPTTSIKINDILTRATTI